MKRLFSGFLLTAAFPHLLSAEMLVFTQDAHISATNTQLDGVDMVVTNCTVRIDGRHAFASLELQSGGRITHSPRAVSLGLILEISGPCVIHAGGEIDLTGLGERPGVGVGSTGSSGQGGNGAGHGGYGGTGMSNLLMVGTHYYGDPFGPVEVGSRGGGGTTGAGGLGGGALKLIVGGELRVDGRISADGCAGTNSMSGGGSGGSLWLKTKKLTGAGEISARGGQGEPIRGGGGSGGRIAIEAEVDEYTGSRLAPGGDGWWAGGAGTVFVKLVSPNRGTLWIDNKGLKGMNTVLGTGPVLDLWVGAGARVLTSYSRNLGRLTITTNGWLIVSNLSAIPLLSVAEDVVIHAGGGVTGTGNGYPSNQGPGAGQSGSSTSYAGGGGYGGYGGSGSGGAMGGRAYGVLVGGLERGSGGGRAYQSSAGGAGGGTVQLEVGRNLVLDGSISADGLAGAYPHGGGGSGGGVLVKCAMWSGSGLISANGGAGHGLSGGGGGGRIQIQANTNAFTGTMRAYGGAGVNPGGAGTVVLDTYDPRKRTLELLVDNGGQAGTNTAVTLSGSGWNGIKVRGGAKALLAAGNNYILGQVLIQSNAWLLLSNGILQVTGDMTIQPGGGLSADGLGYPSDQAYDYRPAPGSGGGHGGVGGGGVSGYAGGNAYGSITSPVTMGAGGGTATTVSLTNRAGAGGGRTDLTISGTMRLEGIVSANGTPGAGNNNGGGAGGSVWLKVGTLAGAGLVSAHGGAGTGMSGGGGGGGRIAIEYTTNLFTGAMQAFGGAGYQRGGAGTIYTTRTVSGSFVEGHLYVNNNGYTEGVSMIPWLGRNNVDVTLEGKAAMMGNPSRFRNIDVGTQGRLLASNLSISCDNLVVQSKGAVSADGCGYPLMLGPNAGRAFTGPNGLREGGGGGHGGHGGLSYSGCLGGGSAQRNVMQPASKGSGGGGNRGSYPYYAPVGSAGGGTLNLIVFDTLRIEGRLSCSGEDALLFGNGGGAGGSLQIRTKNLVGTGTIMALGGKGSCYGGGGGGGCVAIYYATNRFLGFVSAWGGDGAQRGGAGTVWWQSTLDGANRLQVDNGGFFGAATSMLPTDLLDMIPTMAITGGANVSSPNASWILERLQIGALSWLTDAAALAVKSDLVIDTGGHLSVAGCGNQTGPGRGVIVEGLGSGAGYGGRGGNSSCGVGGPIYGSAEQPLEAGSGGGCLVINATMASTGGGALRLNVGDNLHVDGEINADGRHAQQENAGGGSGGSIWISTRSFSGAGSLHGDGGAGDLYFGGGGGGGRIAIFAPSQEFIGAVSVAGGAGFGTGEAGTVVRSIQLPRPTVVSPFPPETYTLAVENIAVYFNTAVKDGSFTMEDIQVLTPSGTLPATSMVIQKVTPYRFLVNLPRQNMPGDYQFSLGPNIEDFYGQTMAEPFVVTFTILPLPIIGKVVDEQDRPLPGVILTVTGLSSFTAVTDSNGLYTLKIPPQSTFTVKPSLDSWVFVPQARSYTNLVESFGNQDYLALPARALALTAARREDQLQLKWDGRTAAFYQVFTSTNLIDWTPCFEKRAGTGQPDQWPIPVGSEPAQFYRLEVTMD